MSDLNKLESELAQMRPRKLSGELRQALEAELDGTRNRVWSDRFLMGAIAMGGVAACVIAVLLTLDSIPPGAKIQAAAAPATAFASSSQTLSQADGAWISEAK